MATFTGTADDGSEVIYTDKKRHMWWLSFVGTAVITRNDRALFCLLGKNPLVTLYPAFYTYILLRRLLIK